MYAPVGLFSTTGRLLHWATAEEGNWDLRQRAADRNDPKTWLELDRRRQRESRWRWTLISALAGTGTAGGLVVYAFDLAANVPDWAYLGAGTALAVVFARLGRPVDKPITDRVHQGNRYRKLTAELVRRALISANIPGLNQAVTKDPGAIFFPQEPPRRARPPRRGRPPLRRGGRRSGRPAGAAGLGDAVAVRSSVARGRRRSPRPSRAVGRL